MTGIGMIFHGNLTILSGGGDEPTNSGSIGIAWNIPILINSISEMLFQGRVVSDCSMFICAMKMAFCAHERLLHILDRLYQELAAATTNHAIILNCKQSFLVYDDSSWSVHRTGSTKKDQPFGWWNQVDPGAWLTPRLSEDLQRL